MTQQISMAERRKIRQAQALRDNLKRRKTRERAETVDNTATTPPPQPNLQGPIPQNPPENLQSGHVAPASGSQNATDSLK